MDRVIPSIPASERLPMNGAGSDLGSIETSFGNDNDASDRDLSLVPDSERGDPPVRRLKPGESPYEQGEGVRPDPTAEEDPNAELEGQGEEGEGQGEEGEEGGEEGDEPAGFTGADALPIEIVHPDGTKSEIQLGELKARYGQFDQLAEYARGVTNDLNTVGHRAHAAVEQTRNQYMASLGKFNDWIMAVVTPEFQGLDMVKLAATDPAQYIATKARIDEINQVLSGIQREQAEHGHAAQAEGQRARAAAVQQSQTILRQAIPGWNDEIYSNVLRSSMKHYGFKPQEIGDVIDPRVVKMAHDAAKYLEMKSGKTIADKRVPKANMPVARPGQGRIAAPAQVRTKQAATRFLKTRSDKDAVNFLMSKGIG